MWCILSSKQPDIGNLISSFNVKLAKVKMTDKKHSCVKEMSSKIDYVTGPCIK